MKNLTAILYILFLISVSFAQDQIVQSSEAQFGNSLELLPFRVDFKRNGKQFSVNLPFKVSNETAQKLLKLADTKKLSKFMSDDDIEFLYRKHVTGGNEDKYFTGKVKQWGQLKKLEQDNFKKNIMPKMKEYFAPIEDISFYEVMEMLINSSNSKKDCNCVDLNGVKIKSCD